MTIAQIFLLHQPTAPCRDVGLPARLPVDVSRGHPARQLEGGRAILRGALEDADGVRVAGAALRRRRATPHVDEGDGRQAHHEGRQHADHAAKERVRHRAHGTRTLRCCCRPLVEGSQDSGSKWYTAPPPTCHRRHAAQHARRAAQHAAAHQHGGGSKSSPWLEMHWRCRPVHRPSSP